MDDDGTSYGTSYEGTLRVNGGQKILALFWVEMAWRSARRGKKCTKLEAAHSDSLWAAMASGCIISNAVWKQSCSSARAMTQKTCRKSQKSKNFFVNR